MDEKELRQGLCKFILKKFAEDIAESPKWLKLSDEPTLSTNKAMSILVSCLASALALGAEDSSEGDKFLEYVYKVCEEGVKSTQ